MEKIELLEQKGYSKCSRIFGPKIFIYSLITEGKGLDVVQDFTEEMGPFKYGRILGVPNTKKGIYYYTIEYNKAKLKENESYGFYSIQVPGIKII
eukprot:2879276-Ditylum_brightwellii.AAC.2